MKLWVVAVGMRIPDWAQMAWDDYHKRFPAEAAVSLKTVKAEPRGSRTKAQIWAAEAKRIHEVLPRECQKIWLDEHGQHTTTKALALRWTDWQAQGQDVAMIIGGADGFDPAIRQDGSTLMRLSDMTLPHAMVRVVLIEQLYRCWSLMTNHPYHRE
jgi:23S rRNA (pseudouridine1915-N3)-methyltransferase